MNYYYHDVPGRLRIKSPLIKRNANAAQSVQKFLAQIQGVITVSTSTVTGSIVLNYDEKKTNSKALLDILQQRGIFNAADALTNDQYIHKAASKAGNVVYRAFLGTLVEETFKGSSFALLSFLI